MNNNKFIFLAYAIAIATFGVALFHSVSIVKAERDGKIKTCSSIGDYDVAQIDLALYKAEPKTYPQFSHLDGDNDGIACELLKLKK